MRMSSGFNSHNTPLRMGRLSSVETAKAVCVISFWRSPERMRQLSLNLTLAAIERDALLAGGGDAHGRRRELASDLAQFLRGDRDRAWRFNVGGDFGRDGDVEIGTGQADALVGRLDHDIREHRQGRFRRNARSNCGKTFLQLFPGDRKPHHSSYGVQKLRRLTKSF
jgi:hypothetical protein